MTFQPFDINALPARNRGPRVNLDEANALRDMIVEHGAASDQQPYDDAEKARTAGMKAVRMLSHVEIPAGQKASVRTFPLEGGKFGYAVTFKAATNGKTATKGASKGK